jgi:hypothetical protein
MKVAFFHGLYSQPISEKNYALREVFDEVYDPSMNYSDKTLFQNILEYLKANPVDLLIGSSMGGYFAYCLSTQLGTRTLLFNPAVHSRPVETTVTCGTMNSNHLIVLGNMDQEIPPLKTVDFFKDVENSSIFFEDMAHIVPIEIFRKYIYLYKSR